MKWNFKDIVNSQNKSYAILLLNVSINNENVEFATHLWQNAKYQACIDGGLNYFDHFIYKKMVQNGSSVTLPKFVSGDLDSASPELIKYYKNKGVDIIHTEDQNETDFTKALRILSTKIHSLKEIQHVIALCGTNSERFDHIFGIIHTLHKAPRIISVPVVAISNPSMYWLLQPGSHTIYIQESLLDNCRSWCGLIPIGEKVKVTTTGLKWNLENEELSFGHIVSTSNQYQGNCNGVVTVKTNKPLLWTMGLPHINEYSDIEDKNISI